MMRLLMCGDRNYRKWGPIVAVILHEQPAVVIEGEAPGADKIARRVAEVLGIPVLPFPADWDRYGKAAGMIRNQQMLDEGKPDKVVAFHDDIMNSRGTRDMVERAERAGIPYRIVTD